MAEKYPEQEFLDKVMHELMGREADLYCVTFVGYVDLGKKTYGQCAYASRLCCAISLGQKFPWDERPLFREAVLYHEACHAKLFLEDGQTNGHDKEFKKLRRAKPLYWIADMVMKLVWPSFMFH